ncbi:MAG: GNAT family N-acetyltransferase [Tenacibaculum sp.]|nr:GNAT family N-acetyltransferase [Tenacibaculum sp.]
METITNDIRLATSKDASLLALLGRITFRESHGGYIEDKTNLDAYLDRAFSFETTARELNDDNNIYYLIYKNNFPVGYAKLVKNATSEFIHNQNICRLERIYVLEEFISQKFGIDLLNKTVDKAKELGFDIMWLSVYIKNTKAIKFYQKNNFEEVGSISFQIGKKGYDNPILAKKL